MSTIVLKIHVKIIERIGCISKEFQWIAIPDNINILKEYIIAQRINHVDTVHLGHHHSRKRRVGVKLCSLFWHFRKVLMHRER